MLNRDELGDLRVVLWHEGQGHPVRFIVALGVLWVLTGIGFACRRSPATPPPPPLQRLSVAASSAAEPGPVLTGPHGGELIELGGAGSRYGVEMTVDRVAGTLQLRVLEGVEDVRIAQPSITAIIEKPETLAGQTMALFPMMPLTIGSRVGSASLFRARAPELRHAGDVSGRLVEITIEDSAFRDIPFVQPAAGGH